MVKVKRRGHTLQDCILLKREAGKHFTKTSSFLVDRKCVLDLYYDQLGGHALGSMEVDLEANRLKMDFPMRRMIEETRTSLEEIGCKEISPPHDWGKWKHLHFTCGGKVDRRSMFKSLAEYTEPYTGKVEEMEEW